MESEQFSQRDIQRTKSPTDGSRKRAFDTHQKLRERLHRFVRQPVVEHFERFFARVHFHPVDFAFPFVGFLHRGVEDTSRSAPDITARPVAFDERYDWIVRNLQLLIRPHRYFCPVPRNSYCLVFSHSLLICKNSLRGLSIPRTLRLFLYKIFKTL